MSDIDLHKVIKFQSHRSSENINYNQNYIKRISLPISSIDNNGNYDLNLKKLKFSGISDSLSMSKAFSENKYLKYRKSNILFNTQEAIINSDIINKKLEEKFIFMKVQMLSLFDDYRDAFEKKYDSHIEEIKNTVTYKTKRINELLLNNNINDSNKANSKGNGNGNGNVNGNI